MPHTHQPHPLDLPNIVSNVIQHFNNIKFLESLRLVNQCWNIEASCVLRRLKLIQFPKEAALQDYNKIFENTFDAFGTLPHAQYKLPHYENKDFREGDALPKSLDTFLENFGEHITLINIPIRKGTFEIPALDLILRKLPCLSTLELAIYYYDNPNQIFVLSEEAAVNLRLVRVLTIRIEGIEMAEESTELLISMLFNYMPNLQKITYPGDIRRISKVGLLLRDIILDSETTHLTRFGEWEFKIRLLEEEALKLLCKDFPMKVLHVDLWNPEDDFECISSELMAGLLRKWDKSLETFSVDFPYRKEVSFHFHFPLIMNQLRSLYLGGFEGSLLELLPKLPSLTRLELSQLDLGSVLPKPGEGEKYASVKQLRLDFCTGQTAGILSRFSRIFSCLNSLNINHTTNEVARVIFQKMEKLTRLRMHGHDLTDAGLCGFSEFTLIENDFMLLSPSQGNSFRKYPFVANLKELQYLTLDAFAVTEITVRHALVHCTSLRLVKIDSTGSSSGCDESETICRTFRLSDYGKHLVEDGSGTVVEMKEEAPLDNEAIAFFESHKEYS